MANSRLYSLFDETNKSGKDLAVSPPKSLADMVATGSADIAGLNAQIDIANRVLPKVDYSNFANFVFFNSALDYFNISGDRMLQQWPYDGTYSDQLLFASQSDAYQAHLLDVWPRWSGCLDLSSSGVPTYITASDRSLLSPSSNSFSVEAHLNIAVWPTGTASLIQLIPSGSSSPLYSVGVSSGSIEFSVSGVLLATASIGLGARWFSWVFSRSGSSGSASFYTTDPTFGVPGSGAWFQGGPYLATSTAATGVGILPNTPSVFILGDTGSVPQMQVAEVRHWLEARTSAQLFANYNLRVFAEDVLGLYWRINEPYSLIFPANNRRNIFSFGAKDYSGNKIDGIAFGAVSASFKDARVLPPQEPGEGFGMSPQDLGEYAQPGNVQLYAPLYSFIQAQQTSGTLYDRNNANLITNLVPYQFLFLEDERNTTVLYNLLYLLGRQFDELKVKIDQFSKVLTANYTSFNQVPDALVAEALKFWGWDVKGNFLSKEAFQHFFGYDVLTPSGSLSGTYAPPAKLNNQAAYDNQRLDEVLFRVKNEFWRRTLNNLIYIYKTKGTRESVEALLRVYGMDDRIVKVKEYGLKPTSSIETHRIHSAKSAWAYHMTGTIQVGTIGNLVPFNTASSMVMQVRFPQTASFLTGSMFFLLQDPNASGSVISSPLAFTLGGGATGSIIFNELRYRRDSLTSASGTFETVSRVGTGSFTTSSFGSGWPVFDGRWYYLALHITGSNSEFHMQHLDEDRIDWSREETGTLEPSTPGYPYLFSLGRAVVSPAGSSGSEYWTHNNMIWGIHQQETEMDDQTLNPFSHGAPTPDEVSALHLNWQFDKEQDLAAGHAFDSSGYITGSSPTLAPNYERFHLSYNYIASPDYGWNEEKIRTFSGSRPAEDERWLESNAVAVEFNLIDALNEDISYMLSSLDSWNNLIGDAANRHRDTYPALEKFRKQYFARLSSRINFRAFADFLDFFDRSFVEMIKKLIPARVNFKGAEFVVESHMLERPKLQYTYRRQNPVLVPEGDILIVGHSPLDFKSVLLNIYRSGSWQLLSITGTDTTGTLVPAVSGFEAVFSASVQPFVSGFSGSAGVIWSLEQPGVSASVGSAYGSISVSGNICNYMLSTTASVTDYLHVVSRADTRVSARIPITTVTASLLSMSIGPINSTALWGQNVQFHATGVFSIFPTGTTVGDITALVAWSSSDTGVATISSGGLVTPVFSGTTTISAVTGAFSSSTQLSIQPLLLSINVNPTSSSIGVGLTRQFYATGSYSGWTPQNITTLVTWSSSDTNIATINSSGLATSVATGSTIITARTGALLGTATLGVAVVNNIIVGVHNTTTGVFLHDTGTTPGQWVDTVISNNNANLHFTDIASDGNGFVALAPDFGANYTASYGSSSDGLTWTTGTIAALLTPFYSSLNMRLTYGSGVYAAIFNDTVFNGSSALSVDGATWFSRSFSNILNASDIIWTGQAFVAVGNNGQNRIIRSTDGVSWTVVLAIGHPAFNGYNGVATDGNGVLIAAGDQSGIARSTDHGATWSGSVIPGPTVAFSNIVYGTGTYVMTFGSTGSAYSTDGGFNWTSGSIPTGNGPILWTGEKFVCLGGKVSFSTDGINWVSGTGTDLSATQINAAFKPA